MSKTESILFGTRQMCKKQSNMDITCNNDSIEAKSSVKYLGLDLDQQLSGRDTGTKVIRKVHCALKLLYRNRKYVTPYALKLLGSSLTQCHYDYGCCIWYSGLDKATKIKLQTSQNKIIRCILGLGPRAHVGYNEFSKLNWLPIDLRG